MLKGFLGAVVCLRALTYGGGFDVACIMTVFENVLRSGCLMATCGVGACGRVFLKISVFFIYY